ncbi:Serine arginine repetitive matrix 1 [Lecanosticta acicola]|uniref:Serine arginine repetitive matrix 1 n=1 Tax=Lecanosticta acicola TaxID=111012 RepID=A0AAI9EAX0_9PEZI|nr:Serine arginine repetitive matrix 1 [Lecanosticta acicola]
MSAALKTGADARAMRTTKFPPEFSQRVDMTKVHLPVIKKWVSDEISKILNTDDDVVTEMINGILEGSKFPNIKQLQNDITGFLDKDAPTFCLELWKLCLSAQANPNGIPKELLEAKKNELAQDKAAEERAREEAMRRQEEERQRDRDLARIRDRERAGEVVIVTVIVTAIVNAIAPTTVGPHRGNTPDPDPLQDVGTIGVEQTATFPEAVVAEMSTLLDAGAHHHTADLARLRARAPRHAADAATPRPSPPNLLGDAEALRETVT